MVSPPDCTFTYSAAHFYAFSQRCWSGGSAMLLPSPAIFWVHCLEQDVSWIWCGSLSLTLCLSVIMMCLSPSGCQLQVKQVTAVVFFHITLYGMLYSDGMMTHIFMETLLYLTSAQIQIPLSLAHNNTPPLPQKSESQTIQTPAGNPLHVRSTYTLLPSQPRSIHTPTHTHTDLRYLINCVQPLACCAPWVSVWSKDTLIIPRRCV